MDEKQRPANVRPFYSIPPALLLLPTAEKQGQKAYRLETSTLELRAESRLPLTMEEELLLLLRLRSWPGSVGCKPLARAKRLRMSVRETTAERWPTRLAPGRAEAETEGEAETGKKGGDGCGEGEAW